MLTEKEAETRADASAGLEDRLRRLEEGMVDIRSRLARLEAGEPIAAQAEMQRRRAEAPPPTQRSDLSLFLSLAGRSFMVLGGAFLLRALTESGRVPRGVGIAAGLAYALVWLFAAARARTEQGPSGATFHGITSVLIGFPLLWEASTRFALLSPVASAGAVALLSGAALAVAWRRDLAVLAAATVLASVTLALALLAASQQLVPFSLALIALGVGTVWLGQARAWPWLGWLPALVADAAVASLTMRAVQSGDASLTGGVIGTQLSLAAVYGGSFVGLALLGRRAIDPFAAVQGMVALGIGLVGAVVVAHARGGEALIGAGSVAAGMGAYAGTLLARRPPRPVAANFLFYAGLALILTLTGCLALARGDALAVPLAAMSVLAAWLAGRFVAVDLALHAAVYGAVAAAASGLLGLIGAAFIAAPAASWPVVSWVMWLTMAATALSVVMPRAPSAQAPTAVAGAPQAVLALLLVLEVSAVVIAGSAPAIAGVPADAGTLATLRTAVLAAAAVLLALARRRRQTEILGWFAYPLLCAIGLKLVVDDFRHSEPATLFIALGLFGVALVATARLVRRRSE